MDKYSALQAVVQVSYPVSVAEKAFIDIGLDGTTEYATADAKTIDLIAIEVLQGILIAPSVSEGDYSVKYDYRAIQLRLNQLLNKHELIPQAKRPTVRAIRVC